MSHVCSLSDAYPHQLFAVAFSATFRRPLISSCIPTVVSKHCPKPPSSSIVYTWAVKRLQHPDFGLHAWTKIVLGAFGLYVTSDGKGGGGNSEVSVAQTRNSEEASGFNSLRNDCNGSLDACSWRGHAFGASCLEFLIQLTNI